jgi:hypothetical protein
MFQYGTIYRGFVHDEFGSTRMDCFLYRAPIGLSPEYYNPPHICFTHYLN